MPMLVLTLPPYPSVLTRLRVGLEYPESSSGDFLGQSNLRTIDMQCPFSLSPSGSCPCPPVYGKGNSGCLGAMKTHSPLVMDQRFKCKSVSSKLSSFNKEENLTNFLSKNH
jgi:hypothetical protein